MRTLQANKNSDKKLAQSRAQSRKKPPFDMASVGLVALVTLVLGGSRRVRPSIIEGLGNLASLARMAPAAIARRAGLHGATFSAADIVRNALELGASSFVLVHNHPGNHLFPSPEDVRLTLLAINAGELLRMPLSDHIIVGPGKHYFSFLENGLMPEESIDPKVWFNHDKRGA